MSPAICALPPAFARATRGRVRGAETRTDLIGKPFHGANAPSLPARSSSHHLWGIRGHDLAQSAAEEGYSAGDNPEARKNPDLYSSLERGGSGATMGTVGPRLAKKPEVLAPCGGWVQLKAAVENGADCVYFGLTEFNARARAANFTTEELPSVVEYLHARGVKGYVTFNILVFDGELENAERRIRAIARAGVDAVIVQDVGVVELFRRVAPGLPVHGSTQMTITSAEGAEFARQLGVERVVVGRELSVREISKVREGTSAEVEAFVHGAMCVSYSGQCFSSEAWGGRSANRGQCAQACRMPYGLLVDGALRDLGDIKYLLSPQDLMAVERVPELVRAGVSCFKIEGRLKGPEYVALTTQVYRRAVDAAWEELTGEKAASVRGGAGLLSPEERRELELVFARGQDAEHRGLTMGFMDGVQHQELVRGRAPRHRGTLVGEVVCVTRQGGVVVDVAAPLKRGDGCVGKVPLNPCSSSPLLLPPPPASPWAEPKIVHCSITGWYSIAGCPRRTRRAAPSSSFSTPRGGASLRCRRRARPSPGACSRSSCASRKERSTARGCRRATWCGAPATPPWRTACAPPTTARPRPPCAAPP
mmetsp:Transcript_51491/g.164657  ORF Transcript_51491/g.164657 Transcript_51491/m.164657 type:complete len:592 (+) Transcript_51491:230-2005(+)